MEDYSLVPEKDQQQEMVTRVQHGASAPSGGDVFSMEDMRSSLLPTSAEFPNSDLARSQARQDPPARTSQQAFAAGSDGSHRYHEQSPPPDETAALKYPLQQYVGGGINRAEEILSMHHYQQQGDGREPAVVSSITTTTTAADLNARKFSSYGEDHKLSRGNGLLSDDGRIIPSGAVAIVPDSSFVVSPSSDRSPPESVQSPYVYDGSDSDIAPSHHDNGSKMNAAKSRPLMIPIGEPPLQSSRHETDPRLQHEQADHHDHHLPPPTTFPNLDELNHAGGVSSSGGLVTKNEVSWMEQHSSPFNSQSPSPYTIPTPSNGGTTAGSQGVGDHRDQQAASTTRFQNGFSANHYSGTTNTATANADYELQSSSQQRSSSASQSHPSHLQTGYYPNSDRSTTSRGNITGGLTSSSTDPQALYDPQRGGGGNHQAPPRYGKMTEDDGGTSSRYLYLQRDDHQQSHHAGGGSIHGGGGLQYDDMQQGTAAHHSYQANVHSRGSASTLTDGRQGMPFSSVTRQSTGAASVPSAISGLRQQQQYVEGVATNVPSTVGGYGLVGSDDQRRENITSNSGRQPPPPIPSPRYGGLQHQLPTRGSAHAMIDEYGNVGASNHRINQQLASSSISSNSIMYQSSPSLVTQPSALQQLQQRQLSTGTGGPIPIGVGGGHYYLSDTKPYGNGYLYQVQFKRAHRCFLLGASAPGTVKPGDFVVVEADRGEDLGIVVSMAPINSPAAAAMSAASSGASKSSSSIGGGSFDIVKPIVRLASVQERLELPIKWRDELEVLELCRERARDIYMLPMTVVDAEYQFDRHKLTIYYSATRRVDFRELVRDLFAMYKTRIWMEHVTAAHLSFRPSESAAKALATGMLSGVSSSSIPAGGGGIGGGYSKITNPGTSGMNPGISGIGSSYGGGGRRSPPQVHGSNTSGSSMYTSSISGSSSNNMQEQFRNRLSASHNMFNAELQLQPSGQDIFGGRYGGASSTVSDQMAPSSMRYATNNTTSMVPAGDQFPLGNHGMMDNTRGDQKQFEVISQMRGGAMYVHKY